MEKPECCEQCGRLVKEHDIRFCSKCGALVHIHCTCDCEKESEK